jgi:hypothetical protein
MTTKPNWRAFWLRLGALGAGALAGVPRDLRAVVDITAEDTDDFWSQMMVDTFFSEWQRSDSPDSVVRMTLYEYAQNVRSALREFADDYPLDRIRGNTSDNVVKSLVRAAQLMPKAAKESQQRPSS